MLGLVPRPDYYIHPQSLARIVKWLTVQVVVRVALQKEVDGGNEEPKA